MSSNILSVDIGTTTIKLAVISDAGEILSTESESYPVISDGVKAEQNPEDWWRAFCKCSGRLLRNCGGVNFELIVLSGQMQDLICLNQGSVSGNAVLYQDTRASDELNFLHREFGEERIVSAAANLSDAAGLPSKILWMRKNHPEIMNSETRLLMGAHDYICWKLTGCFVTDHTNASTTQLLDFSNNTWNGELIDFLDITAEMLPILQNAGEPSGEISAEASAATGLPRGLTVIHGSGDAGSSIIGTGAGIKGVLSCYLGTSGWISATGDRPLDPSTGIFNLKHPDPARVINIGPMLTTGGNTEWVSEILSGKYSGADSKAAAFDALTHEAEMAKPCCGGVFYLPYLSGERSPFRDPDARGAFIGLNRGTGKGELFRSVLEGVAFSLDLILETISPDIPAERSIRISGGGASNNLWIKIIASVTGSRVVLPSMATEAGLIGNLVIAGRSAGWFDSYRLPAGLFEKDTVTEPDEAMRMFYSGAKTVFRKLYPALMESFSDIKGLYRK